MTQTIDQLLHSVFGFGGFRQGQRDVIETLMNGGRALAIFPTGGGKSLCYQLPALALEGTTLVISPLIALMKDQIDFLQARGVRAERLDSSLDKEQSFAVQDALRNGELKLLYVAPERFNNERFLETLRHINIALFAVDEAHCISEWGHNFRPDYLKLVDLVRQLGIERILALTATATPQVARSICKGFEIPASAAFNTGFYRPNLNLCLTPVQATHRKVLLCERLKKRKPGTAIIYVTLQHTAEDVAEYLAAQGLPARSYHAGMDSDVRHAVQEWWMQGDDRIVVATIAFGMGIDKSAVRYIYHYNLPKSLENYSQEIGRAGRDGWPSTVELFASYEDVSALENFVYGDTPTRRSLRGLIDELMEMPGEFSVSEYDLSARYDMRPLVLKTALTYLELEGVLRQGTPFYTTYEVHLPGGLQSLDGAFGEKARGFLHRLFAVARMGIKWHKIDVEQALAKLGCERSHIIRAMDLIEERQLGEVKVGGARKRFVRLRDDMDGEALTESLLRRFAQRESSDIGRIVDVLKLIEHPGCQTNALVGYFGEVRDQPCGHCTYCKTGKAAHLSPAPPVPPIEKMVARRDIDLLRQNHVEALREPRQIARVLCGLTSPAQRKARLAMSPLFGALQQHPFKEVLEWCEKYF